MPRREASGEINPADMLILEVQPPGLGEIKCLLLKLPHLWCFVMAAPGTKTLPEEAAGCVMGLLRSWAPTPS